MAGEGGAQIVHAAAGVADALHCAVDIEFASIAGRVRVIQLDEDVSKSLIPAGVPLVAGPEGIGIELNALGAGEPEEHAAERPVADWQRLGHPRPGGLVIPEDVCLLRGGTLAGGGEGNEDQGEGTQKETGHEIEVPGDGGGVAGLESRQKVRTAWSVTYRGAGVRM